MKISIVLPAYNEEENIERAVEECHDYLSGKQGEIVVVNDGSRDQTASILNRLAEKYPTLRVIHYESNKGYASALWDGFVAASGDWIFYTDSDLQFDVKEIDLLLPHMATSDLVVGYRKNRQDPATRIFAAKVYNLMVRTLFGVKVRDVDCAFKLFRKTVFDSVKVELTQFMIDAEIMVKATLLGLRIHEVGVTHMARKKGQSTVRARHVFYTLLGLGTLFYRMNRNTLIRENHRVRT